MENGGIVSFKIYLNYDSGEPEIRRFGLPAFDVGGFSRFSARITEVFPSLSNKQFNIYWTDEDGDSVAVSSDEEFLTALTSITSDLKKFQVKLVTETGARHQTDNTVPHPGVYCDGCGTDIVGFRFKCLKCPDYDLCWNCEKAGIHADHPMLKIPNPVCFDRPSLVKLMEFVAASTPLNMSHHRKHHSRDGGHCDSHKKKKRSERRESGPESGDEMDDGCHKKHPHKKCRKQSACPYSQMMNYFNPIHFQSKQDWCDESSKKEISGHLAYLKSVGSAIQKLLDPLGVNVEFEVRHGNKTEEKKDKKEEEKGKKEEEEKKKEEEKPSAPPQKEVRFASPQQVAQTFKQRMDEITKILASQTVSNSNNSSSGNSRNSPENDGWVSFEELKKESEESQPGPSGDSVPKESQSQQQSQQQQQATNSQEKSGETLYPDLSSQRIPEEVRDALEKMLSMGFTNEGNWLTQLLQLKEGDIDQVLEVLTAHKKK